ncbi:MAG: N-acetyltransferase [Rhizobacter sp.]|nr:N-acetyltransferase [Bacteriovorax sp.]
MIIIRPALSTDITEIIEHDKRHMKEPGFNGSLSHPFLPDHKFDWDSRKTEKLLSWSRPITEEGWSRSFILTEGEKVVGHIHLKNLFHGTLHRAQLGMGLEMCVRGQGFGKKLLMMAIDWAKSEETLYWIDLTVLDHNLPAKKLYKSCGFEECFTWKDRLRVGPHIIDDTVMMLKLK